MGQKLGKARLVPEAEPFSNCMNYIVHRPLISCSVEKGNHALVESF
jgi:hypothetical protein